jgi:ferritin-like metal-binding protein YciE
MASAKGSNELLLSLMQDIYYAERQVLKALPKMAKAAENPQLQQAFTEHREETQGQVERLQKAFDALGKRARGATCEAINGLIEETEEVIEEFPQGSVRDAGLAACAQAVEHYEMARYGSLIAWAKAGGHNEIVSLLEETLAEEKKADTLLNQLANKALNQRAFKQAA